MSAPGAFTISISCSATPAGAALDRLRAETRRAPGRAALRACRSGDPPADGGTARFRCRPFLSRHLCGRPAGGARGAVHRAGAAATRVNASSSAARSIRSTFPGRRTSSSSATCRRTTTRPSSRPRRLTLNVTRQAMAEMGWCPSGRLFEAAACGAPMLTDAWEGLDAFFEPGREILVDALRRRRHRGARS